ncbi:MAG: insulinase family protein [Propionibacteriaceae bacterium]|jgi:predicted Zn-dependent peptidase|nr:insulinase family protein [Propionibacteriaceae bacterium]
MRPRPPIHPTPEWHFPLPQVAALSNGAPVWLYDLPGQVIVTASLLQPIALAGEPKDREGVATLTARALDEGTIAHPGPAFADALESLGASYSAAAGFTTTECVIDAPADNLAMAFPLFAEAVLTPHLADEDIARLRANRVAEIHQNRAVGSHVAGSQVRRSLFAPQERVSRPAGGDLTTVQAISGDDVRAFHQATYSPDRSTLIVAGDLSGLDVLAAADQAFGGWRGPARAPRGDTPPATTAPSSHVIDRPGAVQADIRFGWPGLDRLDPRWPALRVAICAMGGSFLSRLNRVIREEKGYTYGISMSAHLFRRGGYITVSCSVRTDVAHPALEAIRELLTLKDPFTDEEIAEAIAYLTQSAPLSYGTADAVVAQAGVIASGGLDLDYITGHLARMRQVTAERASEVYRELIDPDQSTLVVVADTSQLPDTWGIAPEAIPQT